MAVDELLLLVNDNMSLPLNKQFREMKYAGSYLITESKTFTPEKSGYYKVIVVGAGGEGHNGDTSNRIRTGGAGGVAISTLRLEEDTNYTITITSGNNGYSKFEHNSVAISGNNGKSSTSSANGEGGTASGGDYNYTGVGGSLFISSGGVGASVGCYIPEFMKSTIAFEGSPDGYPAIMESGQGVCAHGASGGVGYGGGIRHIQPSQPGCVLIIPLEIEEV